MQGSLLFWEEFFIEANIQCLAAVGVFPLPNVKLTWGNFDLFADKMTAEVNPHSECYEVTTSTLCTNNGVTNRAVNGPSQYFTVPGEGPNPKSLTFLLTVSPRTVQLCEDLFAALVTRCVGR